MRRAQRGLTLVELAIAMTLLGGLGLALGAMAIRGASLEREARLSLAAQQELSTLLRRFSSDVREAVAVVGAPGPAMVVLQHADQHHVTYRIAAGRLQRGDSSAASSVPSSWEDLVDPQTFEVSSGRFSFYSEAGVETAVADAMRRVDLVDVRLRARQGVSDQALQGISAALRGNPRSETLEVVAPDGGEDIVMDNSVGKMVTFALRNHSDQPTYVRYIQFAWNVPVTSNPIKQFWIGDVKWQDHQKDLPDDLGTSVPIAAFDQVQVVVQFDNSMPNPLLGTMALYSPDDVFFRNPYLVELRILRR